MNRLLRAPASGETVTFALLGGLIAWILRLVVGSWLVSYACTGGVAGTIALYSVSVGFLAVAGLALLVSMRLYGPGKDTDWEEGELPGVRYVGILGILLNVTALVAILAESVSIPFIDPCEPT